MASQPLTPQEIRRDLLHAAAEDCFGDGLGGSDCSAA